MQNRLRQQFRLISLIFLIGFSNTIVSVLILYFSQLQNIKPWQIMYLQSSFFMCYLLVVPAGFLLLRHLSCDFLIKKTCLLCGLLATAMGLCMQYQKPQLLYAFICSFAIFLGLLRVIVNTQLLSLHKEPNYHSWIKYIMCADTVGAILCPVIATPFLISSEKNWGGPLVFFSLMTALFLLICQKAAKQPSQTQPVATRQALCSN